MTVRRLVDGTARRASLSRTGAGYLLAVVSFLAPRASRGQVKPIEIAYDADPGCPTVTDLVARLRQQADRIDVAPSTDPSAPVHIRLRASGDTFSGRLEIRRARGAYVREILGPSCEETAGALTFVLAQALLPEEAPAAEKETVEGAGVVERTRTMIPPTVIDRAPAAAARQRSPLTWWAGVAGGVRKTPIPSWSATESGWGEVRLRGRGFVPTLGFGVVFSGPSSLTTTDEWTAQIWWLAARASICPARIGVGPYLEIVPCLGTHAGFFRASGQPQTGRGLPGASIAPWIDGLAELRLDLHLAESLSLRLGFEVIAVISRYDVVFDNPKTVVIHVPDTAAAGSLGVALRIW